MTAAPKIADGYKTAGQEWQCGHCGAWVDAGWWRHAHLAHSADPTFEQMTAAREAGKDIELSQTTAVVYMRNGTEPKRPKP